MLLFCPPLLFSSLILGGFPPLLAAEYRSYDGIGNNPGGLASLPQLRAPFSGAWYDNSNPINYTNRIMILERTDPVLSARNVSNQMASAMVGGGPRKNRRMINDLHTMWGAMIGLDYVKTMMNTTNITMSIPRAASGAMATLTRTAVSTSNTHAESLQYRIRAAQHPTPVANPLLAGIKNFTFQRAFTNESAKPERTALNLVTPFLDAGGIYGTNETRARLLRTFIKGKVVLDSDDLPPRVSEMPALDMVGPPPPSLATQLGDQSTRGAPRSEMRVGGDAISNVNTFGFVIVTLFMREHNRLCDRFASEHAEWDDETLYQEARKWVIAFMQRINYYEYLPALTSRVLPAYTGFNASTNPQVTIFNSACILRYGHSEMNDAVERLDERYIPHPRGPILVRDAPFDPDKVLDAGIEPVLRGLVSQVQNQVDWEVTGDLRNWMFGHPAGMPGVDMTALDIQRNRDFGIPPYNDMRESYGLSRAESFQEISSNPRIAATLASMYGSVDRVEACIGGLAEDEWPGCNMGQLLHEGLREQLTRIRDGDKFWYQNEQFTPEDLKVIESTLLRDIIARNTLWKDPPTNVFFSLGAQMSRRNLVDAEHALARNEISKEFLEDFPKMSGAEQAMHLGPAFKLYWSVNVRKGEAEFVVVGRSEVGALALTGWIGVGFEPDDSGMTNADMVFGYALENGTTYIRGARSVANEPPIPYPTDSPGITNASAARIQGFTVLKFTRPLAARPPFNKTLPIARPAKVAYAMNPMYVEPLYHGPERGLANVELVPAYANYHAVTFNSALGIVFTVIGTILLSITLATIYVIITRRMDPIIRRSSPPFLLIILVGVALGYVCIFVWTIPRSDAACKARMWLVGLAYILMFGFATVKNYRIYLVFRGASGSGLSTRAVLLGSIPLLAIEVILLTIWTFVDAPYLSVTSNMVDCWYGSVMPAIVLAYNLLILLCGLYIAVCVRHAYTDYQDSFAIAFSTYNFVMCIIILVPVSVSGRTAVERYVLECIAILLVTTGVLAFFFGAKLWTIYVINRGSIRLSSSFTPEHEYRGSRHWAWSFGSARRNTLRVRNQEEQGVEVTTAANREPKPEEGEAVASSSVISSPTIGQSLMARLFIVNRSAENQSKQTTETEGVI
ncbi:hypothetical protein SpCBS45565_g00284 [Spizellomyces sp. 'palustris']|nr:hypothetical protein SpCBS45565_g00284 [Spizellomyces sp. 'palustris']